MILIKDRHEDAKENSLGAVYLGKYDTYKGSTQSISAFS